MIRHLILGEVSKTHSTVVDTNTPSVWGPRKRCKSQDEYDEYLRTHFLHPDYTPYLKAGDFISLSAIDALDTCAVTDLFSRIKILYNVERSFEVLVENNQWSHSGEPCSLRLLSLTSYQSFALNPSLNTAPNPYYDYITGYKRVPQNIVDRMKLDLLQDYIEASTQRQELTRNL